MRSIHLFKIFVILVLFKINHIHSSGQLYKSKANNKFYIDFDEKFSWFESQAVCVKLNMTLVELETSTKSEELNTLIKIVRKDNNVRNSTLWIGGIMTRFPEKHFVWLSTGKRFNYTNWTGNNPNFVGKNEFCLQIVMETNLGWNDNRCLNQFGFVCERKKIQQSEEIQKQWQQEIQKVKETLQQETQNHQQNQQKLEKELEQQELKLQQEIEKRVNFEKSLQAEIVKTFDLQKALQNQLDSRQQLEDKLKHIKEIILNKQEKIEQSIQNKLEEIENLQKELEIQKQMNEQLQEQLLELKGNILNIPEIYANNIKKEKDEQQRLSKELKTPEELQQQFQEQLKLIMIRK